MLGKRQQSEDTPKAVSDQVTDSLASENTNSLGLNTVYSLNQSLLAQSAAHDVLFASMVSEQARLVAAGQAAAIKSAADIFGIDPEDIMPSETGDE